MNFIRNLWQHLQKPKTKTKPPVRRRALTCEVLEDRFALTTSQDVFTGLMAVDRTTPAQDAPAQIASAVTSTTAAPSTPPKKPPTTKGGGNPTPTVDTKIEASEGSTALATRG